MRVTFLVFQFLFFLTSITACTTTPLVTETDAQPTDVAHEVVYDYTLHHGSGYDGNTAILIDEDEHVLAQHHPSDQTYAKKATGVYEINGPRPFSSTNIKIPHSEPIMALENELSESDSSVNDFSESNGKSPLVVSEANSADISSTDAAPQESPTPLSTKNISLYQRYCNVGQDMTNEDWEEFDRLGGVESLPTHMIDNCIHPKT